MYNSRQKSWNTYKYLCVFVLPKCWFGYYSRLSAPKYTWLTIGEGEGHIWVRRKVWRVNVRDFQKNKFKRHSFCFNNFVISIVATSCPGLKKTCISVCPLGSKFKINIEDDLHVPLDSYNVLPDKGIYLSQMVGEDQTEPFRLHIPYLHVLLKPLLTIASYDYTWKLSPLGLKWRCLQYHLVPFLSS